MQKMDLPGVQLFTSLQFLSQLTNCIQGLDRETNSPTPNTSEAALGGMLSKTDHKQSSGGQTLLLGGEKEEWTEIRSDKPNCLCLIICREACQSQKRLRKSSPKALIFFILHLHRRICSYIALSATSKNNSVTNYSDFGFPLQKYIFLSPHRILVRQRHTWRERPSQLTHTKMPQINLPLL